ncbi:hypothetical protein PGB90_002320 [Kerria lacca]
MHSRTSFFILSILYRFHILLAQNYDEWPLQKNQSFPTRSSPIEIFTNEANFIRTPTPLTFYVDYSENDELINTGSAVEVHTKHTSETHVTGGVLYDDTYIYSKCRFYWNNDIQGDTRLRINGDGKPLEVQLIFYNNKYNNFTDALGYPDGLLVTSILVDVGPNENLDFNEFGNHLDEIEKSNTKINITSSTVFKWFDIFSVIENYFAYPGDYGGCSCATSIVCIARYNRPYISERQFTKFQNLKNADGGILENLEEPHGRHGRPIVYSNTAQEIQIS